MIAQRYSYATVDKLLKMSTHLPSNNKKTQTYKDIITFDTEATTIDENTVITYIWMARINEGCVYGRTPSEFVQFVHQLNQFKGKFYIWVHNLSYDFCYIADCLANQVSEFSKSAHRVLKATHKNVEFRCTYALTNSSLSDLAKRYDFVDQKGEYDYSLIRHYDTPLTDEELSYVTADVSMVYDYIALISKDYESFDDIELTQTGIVRTMYRKYVERYAKSVNGLRCTLRDALATPKIYKDLQQVTYGAYSHANRHIVNSLIKNDGTRTLSADIMSDYPYQMLAHRYPYKFIRSHKQDFSHFLSRLYDERVAMYATFTFDELVLNEVDCAYLPSHKIISADKILTDDGRIVYAKNLKIMLIDIDYQIIRELYDFDERKVLFSDLYISNTRYLPLPMIMLIKDLYNQKTMLKGNDERKREYERVKETINALFGMNLYDIDKADVTFTDEGKWDKKRKDLAIKLYIEDNKLKRRKKEDDKDGVDYRLYQWGSWITAFARKDIVTLNKKIGMTNVLYNDTDSTYFVVYNNDDYNRIMTILAERDNEVAVNIANMCEYMNNKYDTQLSLQDFAPRDMLIGTMPIEAEYIRFKTLSVKRYLKCEEKIIDGKPYHILTPTVSGISKAKVRNWLTKDITPDYTTTVDDKTFVHFAQKDLNVIFNRFNDKMTISAEESGNFLTNYTPPAQEEIEVVDYLGNSLTLKPTRGVALTPQEFSVDKTKVLKNAILYRVQSCLLSSTLPTK